MTIELVRAVPTGDGSSKLSDMSDSELERRICGVAGRLAAATCAWLLLIAEFDRRSAWSGWGVKSAAHWLSWTCSLSPATAREHIRIARALTSLPAVTKAFAAGNLSYSKVRAITRVADSVDEDRLVRLADAETASQLERTVRGFRKATGAGLDQQKRRRARTYWDEDGMLVLSARLTAEEGAVVMAALAAAEAAADAPEEPEDVLRERQEADRLEIDHRALSVADALVSVANAALAAAPEDLSGEDRHLVVLHVDADQTQVPSVDSKCHLDDGPGLDGPVSERMACDAAVLAMVGSVTTGMLNVGRRTRKISAALRRALRSRDDGCRFPGCSRRTHLEAHHIEHWMHGGPTDLDNLVLLCRFHHMTIHEGGFSVTVTRRLGDRIELEFRRPDGVLIPASPPLRPGPSTDLDRALSTIDEGGLRPQQFGEPFSLTEAVDVLCRN